MAMDFEEWRNNFMVEADKYKAQAAVLDPKKLMNEASAASGLSDYGDTYFVAPMTRLLDRAARELNFNPAGLAGYKQDVVRCLVNRLRTQEDIRRHPEILEEDLSDPLIIIGLPRSGTTKLQRMMAAAPEVQKLFMWRMVNPAPFPDAVQGRPDPRIAATLDRLTAGDNEAVQAAHAMAASLVDEEFVLFDFNLDPSVTGWDGRLPLFHHQNWAATGKEREADLKSYRYVRTLLQYLQWQDGGKLGRPWIMKAIIHLPHMDALLECFPKATIVHCHRDPRNAIPSVAKLMCELWSVKAKIDRKLLGREFLEWGSLAVSRYLEARKRLQLDDQILDVKYERIRDEAMPIIREIYQRAGWEMTDEAEHSMLQWERDNEQGKHGKHDYSLQEFGLSEAMIDQAFEEYIDRFIDRP